MSITKQNLIKFIENDISEDDAVSLFAYAVYKKMGVPIKYVEHLFDKFHARDKGGNEIISMKEQFDYDILKLFADGYYDIDFNHVFDNVVSFMKMYIFTFEQEVLQKYLEYKEDTSNLSEHHASKKQKEALEKTAMYVFDKYIEVWKERLFKKEQLMIAELPRLIGSKISLLQQKRIAESREKRKQQSTDIYKRKNGFTKHRAKGRYK